MLLFDQRIESERLILERIDTRWMQRLRSISQTGNTRQVYMFAEHSRFGHCLGVAYLALSLMKHFYTLSPELVQPYENAVAAAALLHDIGHVAPGSHLAERMWAPEQGGQHEQVSARILREDREIGEILARYSPNLADTVSRILLEDESLPAWTKAIISGGGWNADRGNWAIVDSAMCAVTYGRYNVAALIDAFRLTPQGEMVLHESRLDALTHFFVARDSMYRQVYQHRVLQAVDGMNFRVVLRLRDLLADAKSPDEARAKLSSLAIFADDTMVHVLLSPNYAVELPLENIFGMTESWWRYHLERWCNARDPVLGDLSRRLRDRLLFKTIRMQNEPDELGAVSRTAQDLGFDPRYYVMLVQDSDAHRGKDEEPPMVLLDNGSLVPVTEVEPLIAQILSRSPLERRWLAVPKEIKARLGYAR